MAVLPAAVAVRVVETAVVTVVAGAALRLSATVWMVWVSYFLVPAAPGRARHRASAASAAMEQTEYRHLRRCSASEVVASVMSTRLRYATETT